jgi:hypothetical protein
MFLSAVKAILLIIGIILLVLALIMIADYFGLIRRLQSWWADVLCYFDGVLSSVEFQSIGPLFAAIVLAIIGLICIKLALSIQRKAQEK